MLPVILGVDVGLNNLGLAFLSLDKDILFTETVDVDRYSKVGCKLNTIYKRLHELLSKTKDKFNFKEVVYEMPVFRGNRKNSEKVIFVEGLIHLCTYTYDLDLSSYTATQVKQLYGGNSRQKLTREENKRKVLEAVEKELNLKLPDKTDHEIDAIAIVLCHLQKKKKQQLLITK